MKEKIPFHNEKEFNEMMKKTKKGTFSGWYIINPENKSVEFSGNFNRQFKLNKPVIPVNTEYVTRKEFNEYKDSNDQRLTKIENKVDKLEVKVDKLEEKVDKLEAKVDKLEEKVDKLEAKVDKLEEKVDKLEAKVDSGFEMLAKILAAINKRLDSIEGRLDKIEPPK
nr:DUF16 domain-containing protein [Mycoplasmoides pneumoniae]